MCLLFCFFPSFIGTLRYYELLLPYPYSPPFLRENLYLLPFYHQLCRNVIVLTQSSCFSRRFIQAQNDKSILMCANCYYCNAGCACDIVLFFPPLYQHLHCLQQYGPPKSHPNHDAEVEFKSFQPADCVAGLSWIEFSPSIVLFSRGGFLRRSCEFEDDANNSPLVTTTTLLTNLHRPFLAVPPSTTVF
jgi:hypothetical protein